MGETHELLDVCKLQHSQFEKDLNNLGEKVESVQKNFISAIKDLEKVVWGTTVKVLSIVVGVLGAAVISLACYVFFNHKP